jgi:hypothetical protein
MTEEGIAIGGEGRVIGNEDGVMESSATSGSDAAGDGRPVTHNSHDEVTEGLSILKDVVRGYGM